MLQEATKMLSSAFQSSFIKRLCLYLHDCVREEVKSSTFRNLREDKDNKWYFVEGEEALLSTAEAQLSLDGSNTQIAELMLQSEISQKDRYLLYGYLFLTGSNSRKRKSEELLTPLLYAPCSLERVGMNIVCSLSEESLSLNTGALAGLMKNEDEDEVEQLFDGLIDVIPELPLTKEKIEIFLTTLRSIIPDIEVNLDHVTDQEESKVLSQVLQDVGVQSDEATSEQSVEEPVKSRKVNKVIITGQSAVILTKRPTITAGVLHELTQIAEKPNGIFRETALNPIHEEFQNNSKGKSQGGMSFDKKAEKQKEFVPITPLALSDSQENVIKTINDNPLVTVYGPPGTGKSQTIVNLVCHLVASGKTVLVASRMDKAVDVVSERLNGLGAPFLALRAGRANYQKQLNFQLQDLLANKIDLDTDFESVVLVDTEDMKNLFKTIADLEAKCEKIIELEGKWYEVLQDYQRENQKLGDNELIKQALNSSDIEKYRNLLDKIEISLDKTGFISSIVTSFAVRDLKKKLELDDIELSKENIELLRQNLLVKELACNLKIIEGNISKIGNLHQLLETIRDLRKKQKSLAIDILKKQRREALKGLTRDQFKRQRLIIHSKALVEKKKNLQNRLLEDEDFRPLLEAFPCWAVTTYAISESLPLKPGLFDVAIIDEASQCDIASCFPVLFRAKRAVIVGDDKQLPHLSFLEKAKEQSFLSQYDIPDRYQLMWRFRTNSVFDLANYYSANPVLLDEHFRSHPPIINFSNKEFYGGRIRVMNKELEIPNCIELNVVKNAKVDLDNTRNMAETEEIMKKIQEIIIDDSKNNPDKPSSIGVISPFRGQVELIKKALGQVLSEETVRKHEIEVGTAHTFQGDERDIILLSFTLAPNSHFQSQIFLQKPNLFNVAITRARKKLICFISKPVESLSSGLLRSYLEYIQSYSQGYSDPLANDNEQSSKAAQDNRYNNPMEEEIAKLCIEEGFKVIPNFESAGFKIDLIISNGPKSLALETDGVDEYKPDKNVWKQSILERCGWKVLRITAREWYYSRKACINRIKDALS